VKIAVTSSSFGAVLRSGKMTHLEWVEACATRLGVDGVVLALADFPRTDGEYAAQIKKMTTDLGCVPVALETPGLLDPDRTDGERTSAIALAVGIGAGLIRTGAGAPGALPPETFARTVAATKTFASAAKGANVTLTVAPAAGSLLADLAAVHNFTKYVDSAWLRYELAAASAEREQLGTRDRVLIERVDFADDVAQFGGRRDCDGGEHPFNRARLAMEKLRALECEGQQPQMPSVVPG